MKIAEIKQAEAGLKGFTVTGKVVAVYEGKTISGNKNGKDYSFVSTSIKLEDDTGDIYVQFIDKDAELQKAKDKTITCISCSINEYQNKQGATQRSLRANEFSSEVTLVDPAHPEIPNTVPIEEESTQSELENPKKASMAKKEESDIWAEKDLRIARENCNLHATTLICKYFKGSLDEAIAEVIKTSNILVSSVYQGLDFPIKDPDNSRTPTQEVIFKDIKEKSDKIVEGYKQQEKVKISGAPGVGSEQEVGEDLV